MQYIAITNVTILQCGPVFKSTDTWKESILLQRLAINLTCISHLLFLTLLHLLVAASHINNIPLGSNIVSVTFQMSRRT